MPALGLCAQQTWTFITIRCPALTASRESQATQDTSDLLTQASVTFDVRNKKACYITVAPTQTLSPAPMFTSTSVSDGHPQRRHSPPQSPPLTLNHTAPCASNNNLLLLFNVAKCSRAKEGCVYSIQSHTWPNRAKETFKNQLGKSIKKNQTTQQKKKKNED